MPPHPCVSGGYNASQYVESSNIEGEIEKNRTIDHVDLPPEREIEFPSSSQTEICLNRKIPGSLVCLV